LCKFEILWHNCNSPFSLDLLTINVKNKNSYPSSSANNLDLMYGWTSCQVFQPIQCLARHLACLKMCLIFTLQSRQYTKLEHGRLLLNSFLENLNCIHVIYVHTTFLNSRLQASLRSSLIANNSAKDHQNKEKPINHVPWFKGNSPPVLMQSVCYFAQYNSHLHSTQQSMEKEGSSVHHCVWPILSFIIRICNFYANL
jgi:hypothetical protein